MMPLTWGQLPDTRPLTTGEAISKFQIEEGLKIELVAAEPLTQSPAAIAWDEKGHLFVAENAGYPVGPGPGKPPVGALVELRDTNGDGVMDQRMEFAAGLHFPNGLMPWRGGWLVTDAPDLLWLCDTNSDGKADIREVWFTGFATNQTTQLRACYPILGSDGWIYISRGWSGGLVTSPKWTNLPAVNLAGGDFRFRPDGSAAEAIGGNAQFGMSVDDAGRRFLTSNRNPIMHAVAWPHWWKRMPGFFFSEITQDVSPVGGDAKVFPVSPDLTTSGFMPELMSAPHAGTFTSACGLHQHFGEGLPPKFQGSWFICEPAQNLVQRQVMEPDGPSFRSRRATEGKDFLSSSDSWFHPVFVATGPDGALYVADMYRKFIDHPDYMPEEARGQIDFNSGKQMGRIWRISANDFKKPTATNQAVASMSEELSSTLFSENVWKRSTAHRLILESGEPHMVIPHLLKALAYNKINLTGQSSTSSIRQMSNARLAMDGTTGSHLGRARAIRLLADLISRRGAMAKPAFPNEVSQTLFMATFDPSPMVREAAFRNLQLVSNSNNPLPDVGGEILRSWSDDPNAAVRFHLAYCLGQGDYRRMTEALVNILRQDVTNRWTRAVVLSGLKDRMNEFAETWFADKWSELPGDPLLPIGFNDSQGMLGLAYEMGLVYGASGSGGSPALWEQALADKAMGKGWQAALLTGWSRASRQNPQFAKTDFPLLAMMADANNPRAQNSELQTKFHTIAELNAKLLADVSAPKERRVAAAQLLAELPSATGRDTLLKAITPLQPKEIQLAAARALAQSFDVELAERLVRKEAWSGFSPELREVFLAALLAKPAYAKKLLEAVEREDVAAWNVNANQRRALLGSSDPTLQQHAQRVLGKTGGEDRLKVFEEHKEILALKADPKNGREVFTKTCSSCHQHSGAGFKVGPDLTGVKNQPAGALLYHIIVPDAEIYPGYQNYEVETSSGDSYSGLLISENESTITLQRALGEKDLIPRNQITRFRATSSSLMPNELEKTMSKQEMADLLRFLKGE
ncbi:MAG: PVC-type heme-binding CxxCH protein [Verrucomicrobiales bacterium]